MLLKSGEDIIADVNEMCVGEEENQRVVGYYLDKPCVVKMRNPNLLTENEPTIVTKILISLIQLICSSLGIKGIILYLIANCELLIANLIIKIKK